MKQNKRGRPKGKKIGDNGLTDEQWLRIKKEADFLGIPAANHLRRIVSWYFSAKEQERKNIQLV